MTDDFNPTAQSSVTEQFYYRHPYHERVKKGESLKMSRPISIIRTNLVAKKIQMVFDYVVEETFGFHGRGQDKKSYRLFCQQNKDRLVNVCGTRNMANINNHYKKPLISSGILLRIFGGKPHRGEELLAVNPWLNLKMAEFCRYLAQNCQWLNMCQADDEFEEHIKGIDNTVMRNLYREFRQETKWLFLSLDEYIKMLLKLPKTNSILIWLQEKPYYSTNMGILTYYIGHISPLICSHDGNLSFYNAYNKLAEPLFSLKIDIKDILKDSLLTSEQPSLSPKEDRPKRRKMKDGAHKRIDLLESKFNDAPLKWFSGVRAKVAAALDAIEWNDTDEKLIKLLDKFLYETYPDVERDDKFAGNVNNAVCKGDFERWLNGRQQRAKEEREAEEAAEKKMEEERPLLEAEERCKEQEKEKRARDREESFRSKGPGCWHRHGQTIISYIRYADDCEGCLYAEPCEREEQWTEALYDEHPKGRSFTIE